MKQYAEAFKVPLGEKLSLSDRDPDYTGDIDDKKEGKKLIKENIEPMSDLQYRLYAENRRSLLVILQGMDAAGKDGTIRHVMSGINPQGCRVTSFKAPSAEELDHDFLWRIHRAAPPRGEIGIFNRSHYEDVLVVRVHDLAPEEVCSKRYEQINRFEQNLAECGTTILKFFLYISKEEQRERLQKRLDNPEKNWKLTHADVEERKYWDDYIAAYEEVLNRCNTKWAPWFVIPSDHKWFRNLAVSHIILETLKKMDPRVPAPIEDVSKLTIE
jgi:PPK2 family polyphosphate:nucleotide phosphotransferase